VPLPWGETPPVVTLLPPSAVGYALPVPASVVAAHPALIGEGRPAPSKTQAAGPVTLQVPAGTPVDAVTAGTLKILPAAGGTSTVVLSGADGATYTYRNVTNAASLKTVRAGTKLGVSGPGGLTFSISVPDVRGLVDAYEALQSWASGFSVNVRSLPSTIAAAITSPPRGQVLLLTDSGASAAASDLSHSMAGPLVRVTTDTVTGKAAKAGTTGTTDAIATAPRRQLIVVLLANGTPASAARLAKRLPDGHDLLWVAPPGTTPRQAAAYRALAAAHPGFRVESLPAALTAAAAASPANTATELATATLTAAYAATAYRLDVPSAQADTALSWAEEQLGKPYKWAAAGPNRFDCSGLTMDALAQSGITLTHNANEQWLQTKATSVPVNKLQPGDLVFFAGSDGTRAAPGHVGIYAGDGEIIDAPYTGANVRFDRLSGIAGYTGATDPYSAVSVPGAGMWAGTLLPGAAPGRLSQYQSFAQGLSDSTWGPSQFPYLYQLWERESGWNPAALNPVSGAFGIPQSLPAGKMAAAGLDWETDPYTQIMWGISYIGAAYGDPQAAWAHELAFGWY
jgi:cell wall-associated NlpC family hydrolase